MDHRQFDTIARAFGAERSRRAAISSLGRGTLAALVGQMGIDRLSDARAKAQKVGQERKKRRREKKGKQQKLQRNAFGCVDVGKPCRGNSVNCCSGICEGTKPKKGQKDKSRCVAHNTGECQADQDSCAINKGILCPTGDGVCVRTTGNASFCGDFEDGACFACTKDTDCEADFGAGAACVVCAIDCEETGNRVCVAAAA